MKYHCNFPKAKRLYPDTVLCIKDFVEISGDEGKAML